MKRPFEILGVLLAFGLIVAIAFARDAEMTAHPPSTYSTNDTGRSGYRALYETLLAQGVDVSRNERELALLDPSTKTLVESSTLPERLTPGGANIRPLDDHDVAVLRRFVRSGGRLIVLATDIGGEDDAKLGLPTANLTKKLDTAMPAGANAYTAGVRGVAGNIGAVFPLAIAKATPLLITPRGTAAIAYPYGKGEIVAISAPELFGNANIARADNARFALDLFAGRGPVVFDERPHGYVLDRSFWAALPEPVRWSFWIVVGIVVLALIGANVRFAPAMPLEPPDERDSSAYLSAMGSLMRRARSGSAAIAAFADDANRRARRHHDLSVEHAGAIDTLASLQGLTNPGDAALVRAATIDARLRKELS